ncbi:hypothetical protein [Corynebacterium tapiri]|uniref:DUF1707 domain-containing protein n=1 Tax=Corynebacterium tapiri TaxID=1448266 RepID=A0A5C4U4N6_9CORY|nr:hypothetical protein [Corynebacterium tapiri]TNL98748.1 hypothetical protein FHE74_03770 [Corynebacterium tapiri]
MGIDENTVFNADRKRALRCAQEALDDALIDLDDFEEFTAAINAADSRGELEIIERRLLSFRAPAPSGSSMAPGTPAPLTPLPAQADSQTGFLSPIKRSGHWVVQDGSTFSTYFDDIRLDLRQAQPSHPHVRLQLTTVCGSIRLIVAEGVNVVNRISVNLGTPKINLAPPTSGAATVELTGWVALGDLRIISLAPGQKPPFGFNWV